MSHLSELIERYTVAWNERDVATFTSMVTDGCIRHDPGRTTTVSLRENEQRFLAAHEAMPGLHLTNAEMWEHGDDIITVCYAATHAGGSIAGIEVFRFDGDRVAEVWNAPPGEGTW